MISGHLAKRLAGASLIVLGVLRWRLSWRPNASHRDSWVSALDAWTFSIEALSGVFDFNRIKKSEDPVEFIVQMDGE